jgi:hypothetical protein
MGIAVHSSPRYPAVIFSYFTRFWVLALQPLPLLLLKGIAVPPSPRYPVVMFSYFTGFWVLTLQPLPLLPP